jgi:hypothetical protein
MARIGIIGVGAVGARLARQLVSTDSDSVILRDESRTRLELVAESLGEKASIDTGSLDSVLDVDVVVLAGPARTHVEQAARFVHAGISVVSTSDNIDDVRGLLALDAEARGRRTNLIIGAGFAPGLTCLLAAHGARLFDQVEEIHIAKAGTGGPACARQHHQAVGRGAVDWRNGAWENRPGGSGRELCWFPEPIGAQDCYRAALPDALMLVPAFAGVQRVTARVAATRRDRLTARLPMLWPTHPEGGPGAVRVELRGSRAGTRDTVVLGAMDRPAVAAGAVAAVAARWIITDQLRRNGAAGLAELVEPLPFLQELSRRGIKAAIFEGESDPPVGQSA